jgi:hypothetical protein
MFSSQIGSEGEVGVKADQIKQAAFEARNEASRKFTAHQQGCALCRRDQLKITRGKLGKH